MTSGIGTATATFADPAVDAASVTPNDSNDLSNATGAAQEGCRALYVGTTGDIKVTTLGGSAVTFSSVPVGIFPVACTRVWSTGTTASNIVALY